MYLRSSRYLPIQVFNVVGLIIVVTFGSSLDVAAIQAELPYKLDFSKEIEMIGLSNLLNGLVGGWTGSYLFAQTIFTMRAQVTSKLCGVTVTLCLLLLWLLPIDLNSVLLKPYVGAIISLFGLDIMNDWLFKSRDKLSQIEYAQLWATFVLILVLQNTSTFGVIEGMGLSVALSSIMFTAYYATFPVWVEVPNRQSYTFRKHQERLVLEARSDEIFVAKLRGYIFFGSAMDIGQGLLNAILVRERRTSSWTLTTTTKELRQRLNNPIVCALDGASLQQVCPVKCVILDFTGVQNVDSTACVSLATLRTSLSAHGVEMYFLLTGRPG